jgi:hypothetical protein
MASTFFIAATSKLIQTKQQAWRAGMGLLQNFGIMLNESWALICAVRIHPHHLAGFVDQRKSDAPLSLKFSGPGDW